MRRTQDPGFEARVHFEAIMPDEVIPETTAIAERVTAKDFAQTISDGAELFNSSVPVAQEEDIAEVSSPSTLVPLPSTPDSAVSDQGNASEGKSTTILGMELWMLIAIGSGCLLLLVCCTVLVAYRFTHRAAKDDHGKSPDFVDLDERNDAGMDASNAHAGGVARGAGHAQYPTARGGVGDSVGSSMNDEDWDPLGRRAARMGLVPGASSPAEETRGGALEHRGNAASMSSSVGSAALDDSWEDHPTVIMEHRMTIAEVNPKRRGPEKPPGPEGLVPMGARGR